MIYPQRNRNKKVRNIVYFVVAFFVTLSLIQYFGGSELRGYINTLYKPVWFVGRAVTQPVGMLKNYFSSKNMLVKENATLNEEVTRLRLIAYDYDVLQKENSELKAQLGRGGTSRKILGNILVKPPTSPYDKFILDVGTKNGIEIGDLVYISEKIIAGIITEVRDSSSVVGLFSDSGREVGVVLERTGASFSIVGQGGQNYKLEIPKDTDLEWGDLFTYPDGQRSIVGIVYFIDTNSQSAFKTAHIRPPVNVFSYKTVIVQGRN